MKRYLLSQTHVNRYDFPLNQTHRGNCCYGAAISLLSSVCPRGSEASPGVSCNCPGGEFSKTWYEKEKNIVSNKRAKLTSNPFVLFFLVQEAGAPYWLIEARVSQSWRMQDGVGGVRQIQTKATWTGRVDINKWRAVMVNLVCKKGGKYNFNNSPRSWKLHIFRCMTMDSLKYRHLALTRIGGVMSPGCTSGLFWEVLLLVFCRLKIMSLFIGAKRHLWSHNFFFEVIFLLCVALCIHYLANEKNGIIKHWLWLSHCAVTVTWKKELPTVST